MALFRFTGVFIGLLVLIVGDSVGHLPCCIQQLVHFLSVQLCAVSETRAYIGDHLSLQEEDREIVI